MATLLHVTGEGHEPLAAFSGHLVRNLDWDRCTPEAVDTGVDAVVASPRTPDDAVELVARLRDAGRRQQVFLITDGSPGWWSVAHAFDGVHVLPRRSALAGALGGQGMGPDPSEDVDEPGAAGNPRQVPRGGTRELLKERLGDGSEAVGRAMREFDRRLGEDGLRDVAVATPSAGQPSPVDDGPLRYAGAPPGPASPVPPARRAEPATRRGRKGREDPDVLVPALLSVADRLYGVRETGSALAGHARDTVDVDAVAVLVPDGQTWSVVAAVGHRRTEERLTLGKDHWLVLEVAEGQHGVLVQDTDIVRARLAGAPLAAWPYVMACPLVEVGGIVVLARSDEGPSFTPRDLARASEVMHEAGPLFVSALQVRELARRLRTIADHDDPGRG